MKGKRTLFAKAILTFLICFVCAPALAAEPPVAINIVFDKPEEKPTFMMDEPIGLTVNVSYPSGQPQIWISEGFKSKTYYLEMRVKDPLGRLLLIQKEELPPEDPEVPDAPPLDTVKLDDGTYIVRAECEELPPGWSSPPQKSRTEDLRQSFDIGVSGWYSLQAQLSAMVFESDPCDQNAPLWSGTFESDTRYFYIQGSSEGVIVRPRRWSIKWLEWERLDPKALVRIIPANGESTDDFDPAGFTLNQVPASRVRVRPRVIRAFFSAKEVMTTIPDIQVGQTYELNLRGRYQTSTRSYGRTVRVRIVNPWVNWEED